MIYLHENPNPSNLPSFTGEKPGEGERRLFHCTGQVSPATAAIRPRDDLGAVDELVIPARQGVGCVMINAAVGRGRLELQDVAPTGEDHASSLTW